MNSWVRWDPREPDEEDSKIVAVQDGQSKRAERVELGDRIVVAIKSDNDNGPAPLERDYEIVGIVADAESPEQFAVGYNEASDEFIVTDAGGHLISDDALAQDILNEYLEQSNEDGREDGP